MEKAFMGAVACVVVLTACGSNGRDTSSRLRAALTAHGLAARVDDRHDELVDMPTVAGCEQPPIITGERDRSSRDGFVVIYLCPNRSRAAEAVVPRELSGSRIRVGRTVVVSNASPELTREVREIVAEAQGKD